MLDLQEVVDIIKNADLYDLINISLKSNEHKDETVEHFIQRALLQKKLIDHMQQQNPPHPSPWAAPPMPAQP